MLLCETDCADTCEIAESSNWRNVHLLYPLIYLTLSVAVMNYHKLNTTEDWFIHELQFCIAVYKPLGLLLSYR